MVETSGKPHGRHARRWRPALLALLAGWINPVSLLQSRINLQKESRENSSVGGVPAGVLTGSRYYSKRTSTGVGYSSLGRFFGLNRHQSRCVGALLNTCSARDYATMSAVAPLARVRSRAHADGAATVCRLTGR